MWGLASQPLTWRDSRMAGEIAWWGMLQLANRPEGRGF